MVDTLKSRGASSKKKRSRQGTKTGTKETRDTEAKPEVVFELDQEEEEEEDTGVVSDTEAQEYAGGDSNDDGEGDSNGEWLKFSAPGENLAEESDSSDDEGPKNRIGNVPLEWYDKYGHIGYDVTGKKIARKPREDGIDAFLARKDDPNAGRTVYDALNDERVVLSNEELSMINRIRKGQFPHRDFDLYADYTYEFSADKRIEVLGNAQEPKRRFIPSKWEAKKIIKLVHSIRNGWLKLDEDKKEDDDQIYLLWGEDDSTDTGKNKMPPAIPAPKMALPGHAESYNPPPEYLPTKKEIRDWEELDPEDRPTNFLPRKFDSLRDVPGYDDFIKERFERCLDLYLCPRTRRKRLNIDPDSLIPKLPKPEELRPFPTNMTLEFIGHTDKIRSFSVDPRGQWLASGSDDGSVRLWEICSGRCFRQWQLGGVIESVVWNPNPVFPLIAVVINTKVLIIDAHTGGEEEGEAVDTVLAEGKANALALAQTETEPDESKGKKKPKKLNVDWHIVTTAGGVSEITKILASTPAPEEDEDEPKAEPSAAAQAALPPVFPFADVTTTTTTAPCTSSVSYRACVDVKKKIKHVVWHYKGDYFATVSPQATATSVLIHRLSKSQSQSPFKKSKGLVQRVQFHPSKPFFFVASQRHIRVYNLLTQSLVKKLQCPAKWISSLDIHPSGDHVIVGSYDRRVCWYDLDLSSTPYKTLKYHKKAVRNVAFHKNYPLFASCSDDGNLHIFHGMVYNDLLTNPLLVPVKILKVQEPRGGLGLLDAHFHPTHPWILASGSDHVIRLFT